MQAIQKLLRFNPQKKIPVIVNKLYYRLAPLLLAGVTLIGISIKKLSSFQNKYFTDDECKFSESMEFLLAKEYTRIHKNKDSKKKSEPVYDNLERKQRIIYFGMRVASILFKRTRRNAYLVFSYVFPKRPDLTRIIYYNTTGCLNFRKKLKLISKAIGILATNFTTQLQSLCKQYNLHYLTVLINGSFTGFRKV